VYIYLFIELFICLVKHIYGHTLLNLFKSHFLLINKFIFFVVLIAVLNKLVPSKISKNLSLS
jgi:hypothetical protein